MSRARSLAATTRAGHETLYFGIPIAAAFVWIRWIERRARAAREQDETDHDTDG